MSTNSELYEQILANKSVTIKITEFELPSLLNSLRVIKHRYDNKSEELLGTRLSDNKILRHVIVGKSLSTERDILFLRVKISLTSPEPSHSFEILAVESEPATPSIPFPQHT